MIEYSDMDYNKRLRNNVCLSSTNFILICYRILKYLKCVAFSSDVLFTIMPTFQKIVLLKQNVRETERPNITHISTQFPLSVAFRTLNILRTVDDSFLAHSAA
jgi:hypothetical protein